MGFDTVFGGDGSILLCSSVGVPDAEKKLTELYHLEQARHLKNSVIGPEDWVFEEIDDDEVYLIVDSHAHRGTATDFVPNLIVALHAASKCGFTPLCQTLIYQTSWGDSLSGIMRVDEGCNISLVEIDSSSGQISRRFYSFSSAIRDIENNSFFPDDEEYNTNLLDG